MTCPKCNVEMIEGTMASNGIHWLPKTVKQLGWDLGKIILGTRFYVQAFRCPQCNKIELVAAEIK